MLYINAGELIGNRAGVIEVREEMELYSEKAFSIGEPLNNPGLKKYLYGIFSEGRLKINAKKINLYFQNIFSLNEIDINADDEIEANNNYLRAGYKLVIKSKRIILRSLNSMPLSLNTRGLVQVIGESANFHLDVCQLYIYNYDIDVDSEIWISR